MAMDYPIKDHGVWRPYTPETLPDWALEMLTPGGVIVFLRRESDGADFYDYRNTPGRFQEGAVIATTLLDPTTEIETVKSVFRGHDMAFPLNQRLIEIADVEDDIAKVHKLFEWKTYLPDTQTIVEPGPKPVFEVSAAQAKTALFNAGLLDEVEEMFKAFAYRPVKIFFDNSNNWLKSDPYVRAIGHELGLITMDENGAETDSGFDAFFQAASKL